MGSDKTEEKSTVPAQAIEILGKAFPGHTFIIIVANEETKTADLGFTLEMGPRRAAEIMANIGGGILDALAGKRPTRQ